MCEEHITHTELNVHQSNLKIDSYYSQGLFYQSVLPIKRPTTMVSVDTVRFQGKVSNFFWNIKLETMMAWSTIPASNNDSNKTNCRQIRITQDTN